MNILEQVARSVKNGWRRKGVLDLNVPPFENLEQTAGPSISVSQGSHGDVQVHQPSRSTQPAPIDVEELDDDVVISSPRAFEEAKKKSRRSRRALVVDVEAEEAATRHGLQAHKRRRGPSSAPVINCELYVNLEGSSSRTRGSAQYVAPPPPPPPPEPTFSCPVCMGPLVEEVTTKCGHIFCKACITAAINAQHKCPTCRQKLTNKGLIRVYLATAK